ncbi:hypothetical protein C4H11_04580 [Bacteroides zoogleoformans]|uniref:Uncharacterized protein n=1 Tax=Bacteroides zoogleoformans TaxID=28119 RepID=A0ABM6T6L4_9BACE|nr:hypothetical protein C4H11_04580 [Bacteroides zoogleoformans]
MKALELFNPLLFHFSGGVSIRPLSLIQEKETKESQSVPDETTSGFLSQGYGADATVRESSVDAKILLFFISHRLSFKKKEKFQQNDKFH